MVVVVVVVASSNGGGGGGGGNRSRTSSSSSSRNSSSIGSSSSSGSSSGSGSSGSSNSSNSSRGSIRAEILEPFKGIALILTIQYNNKNFGNSSKCHNHTIVVTEAEGSNNNTISRVITAVVKILIALIRQKASILGFAIIASNNNNGKNRSIDQGDLSSLPRIDLQKLQNKN